MIYKYNYDLCSFEKQKKKKKKKKYNRINTESNHFCEKNLYDAIP